MVSPVSYFSDPLDPARSLQLNNRFWKGESYQHLDMLRAADDDINHKRWGSLRKTLKPVKALIPAQYHRALIARIAYSLAYRVVFEPIRFKLKLSDEFLEANRYRGNENEAYMDGKRTNELRNIIDLAHSVYLQQYGRDALYSRFQVRYMNSSNQRVAEVSNYGPLSDYHLDQRADFTCIIYLCDVTAANGCFSYIDGTCSLPKSHLLRALHGIVSFEMRSSFPKQVMDLQLPLELRGSIGMGNFIDDEKIARVKQAEIEFTGAAGDGIIFNGFDTMHRGGKPPSGERLAIFISTAGHVRMRAERLARQLMLTLVT